MIEEKLNKMIYEIDKLEQTTKKRWLKTSEIFKILHTISQSNLKNLSLTKLPIKPKSGEFFIMNGNNLEKKWKNDFHTYCMRKNGVGFKEIIEKLKVNGNFVIATLF